MPARKTQTRRFELVEGTSSKFWEISVEGNSHTVVFGRIGGAGQRKTKRFSSEDEAAHDAEKLVREKLAKGYHEVGGAEAKQRTSPNSASAKLVKDSKWKALLAKPEQVTRIDLSERELTELPSELWGFPRLEQLNLSQNRLEVLPDAIGDLSNLESLDVSANQLTSLPATIGHLRKLKTLDASENELEAIPDQIGELRDLETLGLRQNRLKTLPDTLKALKKLTNLGLMKNGLQRVPSVIFELTNLRLLFLLENQLTELPAEIGRLKKLESLYLSKNRLTSLPAEISKLPKLETLWAEGNPIQELPSGLRPEIEVHWDAPKGSEPERPKAPAGKSAASAKLSNNAAWKKALLERESVFQVDLSGQGLTDLPAELWEMPKLGLLDLSKNQLRTLPEELFSLMTLVNLDLEENPLGELPGSIGKLARLETLGISGCGLKHLPPEIGNLRKLQTLYAAENELESLPEELGNLSQLRELELRQNRLSTLPKSIKRLKSLTELSVIENRFDTLPPELFELSNLDTFYGMKNQLTELPAAIGKLKKLVFLDLDENRLSTLPDEVAQLPKLQTLSLRGNPVRALPSGIRPEVEIAWDRPKREAKAAASKSASKPVARLAQAIEKHHPALLEQLTPGATTAELDQLEQTLGLPLPPSFEALFAWRQGGPELAPFAHECGLMTLAQIASTRATMCKLLDEGTFEGRYADPDDPSPWWEKSWVPFLRSHGGENLVLDTEDGRVFPWSSTEGPGFALQPSFELWLESAARAYEKGLYRDPDRAYADMAAHEKIHKAVRRGS